MILRPFITSSGFLIVAAQSLPLQILIPGQFSAGALREDRRDLSTHPPTKDQPDSSNRTVLNIRKS